MNGLERRGIICQKRISKSHFPFVSALMIRLAATISDTPPISTFYPR